MEIIKDLGVKITKAGYKKKHVIAKCGYCGSEKEYLENSIKTGNTKSCGCERYAINKKALTRQPEYWVLQYMKTRCYNKNRTYYYLYGGRGIKVCNKWMQNPQSFIDWARKNGYKKGLYIDRIDPNGNYTPENCRFVDAKINARNTRILYSSNNSGYRGVVAKKQRNGNIDWRARVGLDGKNISLGVYKRKIDAAKAYNDYVIKNNTGHTLNNLLWHNETEI